MCSNFSLPLIPLIWWTATNHGHKLAAICVTLTCDYHYICQNAFIMTWWYSLKTFYCYCKLVIFFCLGIKIPLHLELFSMICCSFVEILYWLFICLSYFFIYLLFSMNIFLVCYLDQSLYRVIIIVYCHNPPKQFRVITHVMFVIEFLTNLCKQMRNKFLSCILGSKQGIMRRRLFICIMILSNV